MSKVIGYALIFLSGVALSDAGVQITDWHWWAIFLPLVIVGMLT